MNKIKRFVPEALFFTGSVILVVNKFGYQEYCKSLPKFNEMHTDCMLDGSPYIILGALLIILSLIGLYRRHFR